LAGWTSSFSAGDWDCYLVKTDSLGDTLWTRVYGSDGDDRAYSVRQTSDGGYIIAGSSNSFGQGDLDVYLVKTDSQGDTLWTRIYGGIDISEAYSIRLTSGNGYIIVGYTTSPITMSYEFYVLRTSSVGDSLWARTYGGTDNDWARAIQLTADGGYIIAGYTYSFGAGNLDVYLVKINFLGDTLWTHTYGGVGEDRAYSVQQTTNGGYIVAGITRSFGVGDQNIYLIRTDSMGDTLWTGIYGGEGGESAYAIEQTADEGYIIAGETDSFGAGTTDCYVIKTAPDISQVPSLPIAAIPEAYVLYPPYPNPFNPAIVIHYEVPVTSPVTLTIYNLLGQRVATIMDRTLNSGDYRTTWNAGDLPSGIYFCRLTAPSFQSIRKMVLIK
jgi:hypothetical protein